MWRRGGLSGRLALACRAYQQSGQKENGHNESHTTIIAAPILASPRGWPLGPEPEAPQDRSRLQGFQQDRRHRMIELIKVSKIVPSGAEMLTILHALDLRIPNGQFVSIVGPSGSGKSTLLGLIAGLDAPTAGEINIDGENITGMNEDQLAELRSEKLGFVFQSFHLIPSLTAQENILVPMEIRGLRDARERSQTLLEDVGLVARAHHYPAQLSGGEQQRVA